MKNSVLLVIFFLMIQSTMLSQTEDVEIITHKVALGETILMISKKYLVIPTEIYKLNKEAIDGISPGMILNIPQPIKSKEIIAERNERKEKERIAALERIKLREEQALAEKEDEVIAGNLSEEENEHGRRESIEKLSFSNKDSFIEHLVKQGETLTSLSKRYGISIDDIQKENEKTLKKGLQVGQTLKILVSDKLFISKEQDQITSSISSKKNDDESIIRTEITHKVIQGETLYSISKKYNISVETIQKQNSNLLMNGLKAGQELLLIVNDTTATETNNNLSNPTITDVNNYSIIKHYVEPKETLYSISKKYDVSVQEIQEMNEDVLKKGLQSGQEISIRLKK